MSYVTALLTLVDPVEACLDTAAKKNPMLVKIAQAAAGYSRSFPVNVRQVLRKYVDRVPWSRSEMVPFHDRLCAVATARGQTLVCSAKPIAAGTTALVYRGMLDGNQVAIKVLRKNARARVSAAIHTIRTLAGYAKALGCAHGEDIILFLDANQEILMEQCDLVQEARNTTRFRRMLTNIEGVSVPMVHSEFSSAHPDVLVSEWAPGRALSPEVITSPDRCFCAADVLTNVQIRSIMVEGFFHADLHPGNVLYDAKTDQIWILDCGIMGSADHLEIQCIVHALGSLIGRDDTPLLQDIETLASVLTLPAEKTGAGLKRTVQGLVRAIEEGKRALSDLDPEVALALYRNLQKSGCRPVGGLYRVLLSYASNHGLLTSLVGTRAQIDIMSRKIEDLQSAIDLPVDDEIDIVTASDSE